MSQALRGSRPTLDPLRSLKHAEPVGGAGGGLLTLALLSLLAGAFFLGCSEPLTTTEKSAGIGAVVGTSLGGVIGSATGHAGAGAGIGAAIGLIGGALVGEQVQEAQKQQQDLQRQIAEQQNELDRVSQELLQLKQSQQAVESGEKL
jgi:osmotically inducible lipoprotein OsmB